MAGLGSLESFQALYTDLEAIVEANVSDALLSRVGLQFDNLIGDFQSLLDQKARNDTSRQKLATGLHIPERFDATKLTCVGNRENRNSWRRVYSKR
jgi:hypothetical protein